MQAYGTGQCLSRRRPATRALDMRNTTSRISESRKWSKMQPSEARATQENAKTSLLVLAVRSFSETRGHCLARVTVRWA
jgi:hypothetical protein